MPGPSPFDFDTPEPPPEPASARRRTPLAVLLALCAVAAVTGGISASAFFLVRAARAEADEMLADQVAWTVAMNRYLAVLQEKEFWLEREGDGPHLQEIRAAAARLQTQVRLLDQKMQSRWGKRLRPLGSLSPERARRAEDLTSGTRKVVAVALDGYDLAAGLEIERLKAQLTAQVRVKLVEIPPFDLTTFTGRQERDDFMRQLPALDQAARAKRNLEVAERVREQIPSVVGKWVKKAHDHSQRAIAELEADFQRPK